MAYIGQVSEYTEFLKQSLTGDSSTTAFTLDQSAGNASGLLVSVGGSVQEPDEAYTVSGYTITFSVAPPTGYTVYIVFLGKELTVANPADNSITSSAIVDGAITNAKIATMSASKITGALPAIDGSALTGVATDVSIINDNIAVLGFKIASNNSLTQFNMVDQIVDEYQDDTGLGTQTDVDRTGATAAAGYISTNPLGNATGTLISTSNTATTAPTTGDLVMLIDDPYTASTINTDIKGYASRDGGSGWDQVTLIDQGTWGSTSKKILSAHDVAFSNSASGTDMKYKLEWANQSYTAAVAGQPEGYNGGPTITGDSGGGQGGGGAGGIGGSVTNGNSTPGHGGIGLANDITGTSLFYAGGGGGGMHYYGSGAGGTGGSGVGGNGAGGSGGSNATAPTANTGSGGGGANHASRNPLSSAGANGIVVIRVLTSETSGSTGNWDTTGTDGSHTWYKWTTVTSAGTFTPSQSASYEYLVVAGGGGGGGLYYAGGGGAGGYRSGNITVASVVSGISVGAGGAGGVSEGQEGVNGTNSVFSSSTATGGGGGSPGTTGSMPGNGGSGGGSGRTSTANIPINGQGGVGNLGGDEGAIAETGKQTRVHATSLAWA